MKEYVELYNSMAPIIKEVQKLLSHLNLPYSCSLILGILLLFQSSITIKDLMLLTGYAKSTVSTCLNILDKINVVSRVKKGKGNVYVTNVDLMQLLILKQKSIVSNEIEPLSNKIDKVLSEMKVSSEMSERLSKLSTKLKMLAHQLNQLIRKCEEGAIALDSSPN